MSEDDDDDFKRYGRIETLIWCFLAEAICFYCMSKMFTFFSVFGFILFKVLFWFAFFNRWTIKKVIDAFKDYDD